MSTDTNTNMNLFFKKITSSAIGTLVAEIVTLPICTVKTVYQNNPQFNTKQTIQYIYQQSGHKGFVQAFVPSILSQMLSTSCKFGFYELIKNHRSTEKNDLLNNSINGMLGGIIGSIITHPIDIWRNYKQRNQSFVSHIKSNYNNISLKMKFITKTFYSGYRGSLGKNIVLYSFLFPLNDFYKSHFNSIFISAPLTTLSVSLLIQPFDYYKSVKMANNNIGKNYFRGFHLMLGRSLPHFFNNNVFN
jgi:hypothetical protein